MDDYASYTVFAAPTPDGTFALCITIGGLISIQEAEEVSECVTAWIELEQGGAVRH